MVRLTRWKMSNQNALRFGQKVRIDNEVYWHADGHPIPVTYAIHPMIQDGLTSGAVISFVDMRNNMRQHRQTSGH